MFQQTLESIWSSIVEILYTLDLTVAVRIFLRVEIFPKFQ